MAMAGPQVGERAPEFTLPGTGGRDYSLRDFKGHKVVLAFYPGDNTPVCTKQLCSYRDELSVFEGLDATVLGISAQDVDSHEKFAAKHGFTFPLLADTDKHVIKAYGALGPVGFVRRSVYIVDGDGVVRYRHVGVTGMTYKTTDQLAATLKQM
jgi:peroxiredoxin Q/BCP